MVVGSGVSANGTRPVRVLHVIDTLGGGGSERLVWDIVRTSDPEKVRHRVVTVYPENESFVYAQRLRELNAFGNSRQTPRLKRIDVAGSRFPTRGYMRALMPFIHTWHAVRGGAQGLTLPYDAMRAVIGEYRKFRPDIIHGHVGLGLPFGAMLKGISGRPFVFTMTGTFSQFIDRREKSWLKLFSVLHKTVDFFITAYRQELLELGVPPERILDIQGVTDLRAINNARELREFHREEVTTRLGIPRDSTILLAVGRLILIKGHEYSIRAMPTLLREFPNLHLVVLGEGVLRPRLEALVEELGLRGNVHLPGFVEDPLPFYACAQVYLRTPIIEGDNLSSFQAMAMGLPVAGFDTGCSKDLLPQVGHGISAINRDPDSLAAAVRTILALDDCGQSLGAKGAEYCRQHFDMVSVVEALVHAYQELRIEFLKRGGRAQLDGP